MANLFHLIFVVVFALCFLRQDLTVHPRLASNLPYSILSLPSADITCVGHYAWLHFIWWVFLVGGVPKQTLSNLPKLTGHGGSLQ